PPLRREDGTEEKRPPDERHACGACDRLDPHRGRIGIRAGELEPELERRAHPSSVRDATRRDKARVAHPGNRVEGVVLLVVVWPKNVEEVVLAKIDEVVVTDEVVVVLVLLVVVVVTWQNVASSSDWQLSNWLQHAR